MEKTIDFGPIADLYDYYTNVDFDIAFYKTLCRGRKNVLELMCGTGRVSIPLIKEGIPLTCVDYSDEMLEILRMKIDDPQNVRIVCQDVCDLDLNDQYDLIFVPFNSFSEIVDPEKRRRALRRIYEHLTDNGIFFCSLYNPQYRISLADGTLRVIGTYDLGNETTLFMTGYNVFSPDLGTISGTQFYEIYQSSRLEEKRCLDINFAVISKEEICGMAVREGFALKAAYGDYTPYHYDESSRFMNLLFVKKRKSNR